MGPVVGWGGWLSHTRPIPRSPDGDNNMALVLLQRQQHGYQKVRQGESNNCFTQQNG